MTAIEDQARSVFLAALEHAPDQWPVFLDEACGGRGELRLRVEQLLQAHEVMGSIHARRAEGPTATIDDPITERPGTVIGPYKLIEQIGEGGMGTVWMAQQIEPVKRVVALKLIKAGMDSKQVITRFEAERQALALMDHANIARVLDAGTTSAGRPYFVMDLVKGVPITKYCDEHHLTPRQRLELFIPVCQAVQHAHQKGIIHRDLKPSNVLVAHYDGRPVPKVIDFGVAKAAGQSLTEKTLVTGFGAIVGTLEYMSPEQAEINQLDIDTRSDIYSLGVLLYELLTGSPPFTRKELEKAGMLEMLRVIREKEPSKPSTKLSTADGLPTLAANRGTEPAKLTKLVRGELDWIVMKALEKDRSRRYDTANGFAMDVQRYLADEAVHACPPSTAYRFKKFVRRNKGQVIAASLVLVSLLAGIVGSSLGLLEARRQATVAEAEKRKAEEAEAATLADYRASTDDAIEQLIGSKPELGPRERTYLEKTLKRWQVFAARQGEDERSQAIRAEGHFRVAFLWQKLGRDDEARREYETARDQFKKLADAFPADVSYQHDLANTHFNVGILLAGLGRRDESRRDYETARDLLKKLADAFPVVPAYRRDLARTHGGLGSLLLGLGQRNDARREYETARDLLKKLADAFPDVPEHQRELANNHNGLGSLLLGLGQRNDARREHETARDLLKKLADAFPDAPTYQQDLAYTHNSLGTLLLGQGQRDEARREFETARDLQKKLADAFRAVPFHQHALASARDRLGSLLSELGQPDEARREYESARDLRKKLVDAFPNVPVYRQELAYTHNSLGILLRDQGRFDEAHREHETARDLRKKLVDAFPDVPGYRQELAITHNSLGIVLADRRRWDESRREYESARDLRKKLVDAFPDVPGYQVDLGGSYCNFGALVLGEGKAADSLQWFDLAIQTLTPIHEKEPRDVSARQFLHKSHTGRGVNYDALAKPAEAVKDWDRAVALLSPAEQPAFRAFRAKARMQAGSVSQAVAEVAELTKSARWNAVEWYNFACVYGVASGKIVNRKQEYADRAMELLHQAVKAGFNDAAHIAHMKKDTALDALREREDFKKLMAELEAKKK